MSCELRKIALVGLLAVFLAASVFAITPTVTVFQPTGISPYYKSSIDVNFTVVDANAPAHAKFDGNVWVSTAARGYTYSLVNDNNLLDANVGVGQLNCTDSTKANIATTGMYCGVVLNTRAFYDGNWFIDVNVTDAGGLMGTGSSNTFLIDNNAASDLNWLYPVADLNTSAYSIDVNGRVRDINGWTATKTNGGARGVKAVWYRIQDSGNFQQASLTNLGAGAFDFNTAVSIATINSPLDFNLTLFVEDNADNNTSQTKRLIHVDRNGASDVNILSFSPDYNTNAQSLDVNGRVSDIGTGIKNVWVRAGTLSIQSATLKAVGSGAYDFNTTFNLTTLNSPVDFNVTVIAGDWADNNSVDFNRLVHRDRNSPIFTVTNYNTWKNSSFVVRLTCSDTGTGCRFARYKIDQVAGTTATMGALNLVTYTSAINIDINYDGNYAIDFNASDYAGNDYSPDINRLFALLDTNSAQNSGASTDFTADVNQTGIIGATTSTDAFVGLDQNIKLRILKLPDTVAESSPYVDVNVLFTDINSANTTVYTTTLLSDGNYVRDYNMGQFDINFTPKYVTIRIKDQAGNQADRNILNPIIPYTLSRPTGLDNNSTNFQTVTNFEVIPYLVFAKSGLGKIMFTQDINLSTYAQAVKLMQLENALTITTAAIGKDKTVTINSSVFSDINKSARISVYGLFTGLASSPRILKDDANCGGFCTKIDYNSETGQLDFNVSQFSTYTSDSNAPVISNVSPTTTQVGSGFSLSLTTNETATCRYGTTDVNYDSMGNTTSQGTSHSWSLSNQVNGTTTYYFQCRDLVSFDSNTSKAVTVAISGASAPAPTAPTAPAPSAPAPSAPTAPTAPAPEVVVVATETNVIPLAIAGETVRVPIETAGIGVTQLQIELANAVSNASVTLSVIETPPAETGSLAITVVPATGGMGETVAPKVYQYLQVEKQNITNEDITKATIGFKVEKSWLQANGLNASDVALYRFTNEWNALSTSFAYETTDFAYYTAVTPGFSYFAIGEKPKVEAVPMPRVITEEIVPVEEIAPTGLPTLPAFIPEAAPTDYSSLVAIIIIIIVIGIAVYLINEKKL